MSELKTPRESELSRAGDAQWDCSEESSMLTAEKSDLWQMFMSLVPSQRDLH